MSKYRITEAHFDTPHNIHKLRADGFSNEQIHKAFYKATDGASTPERRQIFTKLHKGKTR